MDREIQFIMYSTPHEDVKVEAVMQDETLWLSQRGMAQLFGVSVPTINYHLSSVYEQDELEQGATVRKFLIVQQEGSRQVSRKVDCYNLDAIISVGYRVNSRRATHFRQWATRVLNEYIRKGFVLDDERLKQGGEVFGQDYFRELLDRVRSIRASERRIWQQITDIFAECSIDYDRHSPITQQFYATVQNKFHYAITGQTAAEIVYHRADATQPNMGLMTWKYAPDGRILKQDVTIAKNYLDEASIRQLERAVSGFFDYIEGLIERGRTFSMEDFAGSINAFLSFQQYEILDGCGQISRERAVEKAGQEYEAFNRTQRIVSDFDREIKQLEGRSKG